jgi:colanic acid biosynthesis glycosyl transferase WcaI
MTDRGRESLSALNRNNRVSQSGTELGAFLMRILVLTINYWPEDTGIGAYSTARCEYLASQGHKVTVCTGIPYYPEWKIRDAYRGRMFCNETHNDVNIMRSYLYVPRRVTSVRRVFHEASYTAMSLGNALRQQRPDVIIVISPPLPQAVSGILLSWRWKVPYIFHVEDLQPDAAGELGMLPKPVLKVLRGLEKFAYQQAALVSTLTEPMAQRIVSKGIPSEKVAIFPHWADPALFDVPVAGGGRTFRESLQLGDGHFVVLHSGNMGVKQGLDVVIKAAALSRDDHRTVFLLVGDGAARPSLEKQAAAANLDNVRFMPLQPREVFYDMLAGADVTLITQQRTVSDIVFPSKTVSLLAAGRPIIGSLRSDSEVARVLEASRGGLVVPPEDPSALFGAIGSLRNDARELRLMGERGRAYARQRWDRSRILPQMEHRLEQAIATAGSGAQAA